MTPRTSAAAAREPEPLVAERTGDVVLLGPANVGKSVIFCALTKRYVAVSNYPGTTVEISTGSMTLGDRPTRLVDTPGVNSLLPNSEDERVARDLLLAREVSSVVLVGDAKSPERVVTLALQVAEMDLPHVLCLNMQDEARERGIDVDTQGISAALGIDVVATIAVRKKGIGRLRDALAAPRTGRVVVRYPAAVEQALARIVPLLPAAHVAPRALGILVLAGDETLVDWLRARVPADTLQTIEDVRQELRRTLHEPVAYVVHRARADEARRVLHGLGGRRDERSAPTRRIAAWLERASIHRFWGLPILALVLFLVYEFVGVLGAGTLVGWLENGVFGQYINPGATALFDRIAPWAWLRDLFVGPYGVITMALTYALALILPIVTTFFLAFGAIEDSGYLPRLAVIVNRGFRRMGLNGKAVLPMVLGLGCDTMATLTARILETKKERIIVTLLLALGVPCSAQLSVVLAMLGALSLTAALIWLGVVIGTIVLVGALAARVIPGRGSDFILELPPLRLPKLSNIAIKTLARLEWYLKEAVPLFVLGTLILFVVDRLGWLGTAERAVEPVVKGLLGLPREAAGVFLIGFLRRDFGAAGLYTLADQGRLDPGQILVAVVTITLFMPCIANFFMIVKERGWRTAAAISGFVFPFALGVGALLHLALVTFDIHLR
jgi:ferrous iron transport protein B